MVTCSLSEREVSEAVGEWKLWFCKPEKPHLLLESPDSVVIKSRCRNQGLRAAPVVQPRLPLPLEVIFYHFGNENRSQMQTLLCLTVKRITNKYWKTMAEMTGSCSMLPQSLSSLPCHTHSVRKSPGVLCHHPLVKGHIKPGGKLCKICGKTPRRPAGCWFWVVRCYIYASILKSLAVPAWELLWQGERNG